MTDLIRACQEVSNAAVAIQEKSYRDGKRMADQITVGQRGIAERIVGDHLSQLASAVAAGESPESAYARLSKSLSESIERFNSSKEYQAWRSPVAFGQENLRAAFWKLRDAHFKAAMIQKTAQRIPGLFADLPTSAEHELMRKAWNAYVESELRGDAPQPTTKGGEK